MDRAKLRLLLQEHHQAAYGWALSCCRGNRDEAEDILQTVYLQILDKGASFGGRSSFKTWLFSVIRNHCLKRRHRIMRRIKALGEHMFESAADQTQEKSTYRRQLRERIFELLGELSGRQQEVLQLVFYHELTIEDAARVMGVSLGSARTHYERGKRRLREILERSELQDEYGTGRYKDQAVI